MNIKKFLAIAMLGARWAEFEIPPNTGLLYLTSPCDARGIYISRLWRGALEFRRARASFRGKSIAPCIARGSWEPHVGRNLKFRLTQGAFPVAPSRVVISPRATIDPRKLQCQSRTNSLQCATNRTNLQHSVEQIYSMA